MDLELSNLLLGLVASDEIVEHFSLVSIKETNDYFVLVMEEKESFLPIQLKGKLFKLNGFENKLELHTFPLKGKKCFLHIYRRRWCDNSTGKTYSNNYTFHKAGMKATDELGAYLKKIIELKPIQFSSVSQILDIDSQKIRRWYKEVLSGFSDSGIDSLHEHDVEIIDKETGEIKNIFVPLCIPENIGTDMCVDETMIGETFFTIITNRTTGKLSFMAESTKSSDLITSSFPIKNELKKVEILNRDLASSYRKFTNIMMPKAKQVVDNFHIIKLLLDASQSVRMSLKRKIDTEKLKLLTSTKKKKIYVKNNVKKKVLNSKKQNL